MEKTKYIFELVNAKNLDSCKIYPGAKLRMTAIGKNVTIGEDSYISKSVIGDYVQINRRNQIEDVIIGNRTFTGANTVIHHAEIGKFTSISWNVSFGGWKGTIIKEYLLTLSIN